MNANFLRFAAILLSFSLCVPLQARPAAKSTAKSTKPIWFHSRKDALAQARKTGKPILVDVNTTWCGPCQMMKRDVFLKPSFAKEAARWVLFDMDGDKHAELASFYGVQGFPTLLVLNSRGKVVMRQEGYGGPAATLKFLERAHKKAKM
jgi:thiol:disulfide interchange protein